MLKSGKLLVGAAAAAVVLASGSANAVDARAALFGDLRFAVDHSDSSGPESRASGVGGDTDFRELNNFIGVKASGGQGGIAGFAVYESYFAFGAGLNVESARQAYAGISSPWGTLAYGRMFTDYARSGMALDPFQRTSLASANGGVAGGSALPTVLSPTYTSYGLSPLLTGEGSLLTGDAGSGIQSNQIAYTSPALFGVTLNAGVFLDEADGDDTGASASGGEAHDYAVGASFSLFGISGGVQHLQLNEETGVPTFLGAFGNSLNGTGEAAATRVHAGFARPGFGVAASAERVDLKGTGVHDEDYYFVSAWYGLLPHTRVAASFGRTNETGFEGSGAQVGIFHDIVDNLTVHAGASFYDLQPDSVSPTADDTYIVSIGASYKFDLGFSVR